MNMRRIFFRCGMLCMLASSMMFTSCLQEEDIVEMVEDKYNHDFKETFGKVDPNHTWSTASIGNVTANISGREGNYTLKLYTSNPRLTTKQAYLLAKYDIKGGETIDYQFDMPASLKYVYAALVDDKGYRMVKSAQLTNGKVNFDFSTGGKARTTSDDGIVTYEQTKDSDGNTLYYYFNAVDYNTPLTQLPEEETYYPEIGLPNGTILHRSFLYESTGVPFTIYPFYNITNNAGFELGIYYYTSSGRKDIGIWNRTNAQYYQKWDYESEGRWENLQNRQDTPEALEWAHEYKIEGRTYDPETEPKGSPLRIPGITINIPQGVQFGFYITTNYQDNATVYSESSLNPTRHLNGDASSNYSSNNFAATYHKHSDDGKCEFYLTFEDGHDFDYNDLIVRIGDAPNALGEVPPLRNHENVLLVVDREEEEDVNMSYIVAYEDLGVNDFDFNDVVLGIDYISTNQANKTATFKLMAAGGTLPVSVAYNTTTLWEEIHQVFGVSSNTPVNVKGNTKEKGHISKEIAVEDNFTILADASKLKITVSKNGIDVENISIPNPDETGGTPQAILVASPTWEWPTEGQLITSHPKYGKDFAQWITETTFTNWWDNKYTWSSEENPEGGDNTGGGSGEGGEIPNYGTSYITNFDTNTGLATISLSSITIGSNGITITIQQGNEGQNFNIGYAQTVDEYGNTTYHDFYQWQWINANEYTTFNLTTEQCNEIQSNSYNQSITIKANSQKPITELYIKPAE